MLHVTCHTQSIIIKPDPSRYILPSTHWDVGQTFLLRRNVESSIAIYLVMNKPTWPEAWKITFLNCKLNKLFTTAVEQVSVISSGALPDRSAWVGHIGPLVNTQKTWPCLRGSSCAWYGHLLRVEKQFGFVFSVERRDSQAVSRRTLQTARRYLTSW